MHISMAEWLFSYQRKYLRADIAAGLTTAAVTIPKAMAYAAIAGLPVEVGLYTALAAMLVYPLLGSSRVLSVTTTSEIAMLTGTAVIAMATQATAAPAATVAATLTLLVGAMLVAARLLRLGFLANFVSLPVLVGFKCGVAVVIIVGQLPSVLGVHTTSHSTIATLLELPSLLPQTHSLTLLVALSGIALLVVLPRLVPRLSAPMTWTVLSIAVSAVLGLEALGVKTVGAVPAGLPRLSMPDLSLVTYLWPAALGVALMSFTESVAAARSFSRHDDPPVSADRELLAIGAANLAAALVGGLPAGGGTSQTAVADAAGTRSQMAQWVNVVVVLVVLLFLSGLIGLMPKAALAALVVVSAFHMIEPESFRAIARIRNMEWIWSLVTLAGVILIGTLNGILLAVAISLLTLMYVANHPPVYAVAWNRAGNIFRRVGEEVDDETIPGLLMLRTEGRLTFANAANAAVKMQLLVAQYQPRVIVLECSAIPDIEYTALTMLTEYEQKLRTRGVALWLAGVNPDLHAIIERSPLGQTLGRDRVFYNLHKAVAAWQQKP